MDNTQGNGNETGNQQSGGYGQKGGWKKWLLIYVVIAIVVYGGYYLFKQSGGSTGTGY